MPKKQEIIRVLALNDGDKTKFVCDNDAYYQSVSEFVRCNLLYPQKFIYQIGYLNAKDLESEEDRQSFDIVYARYRYPLKKPDNWQEKFERLWDIAGPWDE